MDDEDIKWLEAAQRDDPEGVVCGFCGGPNQWADDCGFFYLNPDPGVSKLAIPTCGPCYKGDPGKRHRNYYGVGER